MIMKYRLFIAVLALVAAGCGGEAGGTPGSPPPTAPPTSVTGPAEPLGGPSRPDPQEAGRAPAPVSEPILTPVPDPVPGPTKPDRGLPTPPEPRTSPDPAAPGEADIAGVVADLSGRLGVEPSEVEVLDAREVTWRDGSVGCPKPGLAYTQALVPGSLIVLRVGTASYRYHAAEGGVFFYCERPQAPLEGGA